MTCPVCRAQLEQGPRCRRCRADLSLLFALEEQRRRAVRAAYQLAARGRWHEALALSGQLAAFRRGEEPRRLLALSRLLCHDFARAWQEYQTLEAARRSGHAHP